MSIRPKTSITEATAQRSRRDAVLGAGAFSLCAISHSDLWNTPADRSQQCDGGRLQTSSFFQGLRALRFPSCTPMTGQKKAPRLLKQWRALNARFAGYRLNPASISRAFCQCSTGRKTVVACIYRCLTGAVIGPVVRTLWPRKNQCSVIGSGRFSRPSAVSGFSNFKVEKPYPKKHHVKARESVASVVREAQLRSLTGMCSLGLVTRASWNLKPACVAGGPDSPAILRRSASKSPRVTKAVQLGIWPCTRLSGHSLRLSRAVACGATFDAKKSSLRRTLTRPAKWTSVSAFGPQGSTGAPRAAKRETTKGFHGSCRSSGNGPCSSGFGITSSLSGWSAFGAKTPFNFRSSTGTRVAAVSAQELHTTRSRGRPAT